MTEDIKTTKRAGSKRLAFNFVLLSGGEALSKVFAFVSFAYLARILGPDSYGDIEFALAVTLFFNLAVEGGLGLLGAREIAKDESSLTKLTFHIVVLRLLIAFLAFGLLILFVMVSGKTQQERELVLLYGITIFCTPGLLQWVFQALDKMEWVAISSVIRWALFAAMVFIFVTDPSLVRMVPVVEIAALVVVVVFNFGVFRKFFGRMLQRFDFDFAGSLLKQSIPIGMTQLMWGLKVYLPLIMLGLMVGGDEVGWFGASHRVVIALHTFVWMYYFNIYPSIARCTQEDTTELKGLVGRSIGLTAWAAVFIGAAGTLLAEPALTIVYGPKFATAAAAFKVLIWLVAFTLISGHYMYTLIAYNKQWLELMSSVTGALLNIVLNYVLILKYGFLGAAIALLITESVTWSLHYHFVRRDIAHLVYLRYLIKPAIAGAVMSAVLIVLAGRNFFMLSALAAIVYLGGMLVLQPSIIRDFKGLLGGAKKA